MNKIIYLIRHSGPFVNIKNYEDYENVSWEEYNKNMILSVEGEKKAEKLCEIEELKNIDDIYSSNSFRAIATAKYLAENNNTKIQLDDRINERKFGCKYLNQLPLDFTKKSFDNKNYKFLDGESLNEMDSRLNDFINEILNQKREKTIIVIHGIMLLSFLSNVCDYKFDGEKTFAKYNNKLIINVKPKNPGVYKITYSENNEIIDIDVIN
ncbi:MAG: histidine phosphatase family protein [Firmicutes bacterium]|nr:histidine phosphatase family protein [Bacillota bacterium]